MSHLTQESGLTIPIELRAVHLEKRVSELPESSNPVSPVRKLSAFSWEERIGTFCWLLMLKGQPFPEKKERILACLGWWVAAFSACPFRATAFDHWARSPQAKYRLTWNLMLVHPKDGNV